jgi:DNA-directed RNA polymerase subunit RPC12/RpoP
MLKCNSCRRSTPLSNLRYEADGSLVCRGCFEKKHNIFRKPTLEDKKPKKVVVDHKFYVCKKCNYEFSKREGYPYKILCPYCNSDNVVEKEKLSAESLIKEVDKSSF